jgi:hypothetical protein
MKIIKLFIALVIYSIGISNAQVSLPFQYSFDSPFPAQLPNGVSINLGTIGNSTYTTASAAHTIPACKLDATGEFVQIWFANQTNNVSYWLKGSTPTSSPFSGTFTIQESSDGITWTSLRQLVNTQLGTSNFVNFIDYPLSSTRYIRFYFTNKTSGSNVGLDDIQINTMPPLYPEIALKHNNNYINNGDTINVLNTNDSLSFQILNLGSSGGNLTINTPVISGLNSADFTVITSPTSVAPLSIQNLIFAINNCVIGNLQSTISISNNDSDENPFVFTISTNGNNIAANIISNDSIICPGENATLTANGGLSFQWSTSEITQSIQVSPILSTNYTLLLIDSNNCTQNLQYYQNVSSVPIVNITSTNDSICLSSMGFSFWNNQLSDI